MIRSQHDELESHYLTEITEWKVIMKGKWGEGELRLAQWHHAYIGLAWIILSHWMPMWLIPGWITLTDDLLHHFIQWRWDVSYQSPLKYLYGKWIWEPLHK